MQVPNNSVLAKYQQHQQHLLLRAIRTTNFIFLIGALVNCIWLPTVFWKVIIQNTAAFIVILIGFVCSKIARHGQMRKAVRIYLATAIALIALITLNVGQNFILNVVLILTIFVLLSTFLESPRFAHAWGVISAIVYPAALTARIFGPFEELTLVPADLAGFYAFPIINFVAIALIGRGAALRLSNTLAQSEDARSQLEKKNHALKDAQAELYTTNEQLQVELYERKRAEKALRKIHKELEKRVEERTAELASTNEDLKNQITERKQADKALRESEEKYRVFTENVNDAIVVVQEEKTVYRNPTYEKIIGYTLDETKSRNFLEVVAPKDRDRVRTYYLKRQKGEDVPSQYEVDIITRDGKTLTMEVKSSVIEYQGKHASMAVMRDTTERKRAEEALSAEKERLAVTLGSIGDGVITTNIEGIITLINKAAEDLTGWTQEEALGKPLSKVLYLINEFTRGPCENPIQKVIECGKIVGLANNTVLVSKDGKEYVIADSGSPIMDSQNKIIGAVLVFRDITEKRKMEEELVKAQKLESLGVLAGGIAHDFNNFLTAIIGNLSLAKLDSKPGDRVVVLLNEMEKASLQAKDLTQQLLTFSKGGEPVKKLVNLIELIKNSATFSLRGSNVRCDFSISEDLLPVEVDEGQIVQVLNNLVLNADHAMPEGGIIEICAENITLTADNAFSLSAGSYLRTSFQDQGVGIHPDHLPKVFDPYFTTKQKGSGLGLTVAYSIIDKHSGRLTAESELGHGTVFTMYLPASEKPISQPADEEIRLFTGKGKILVMDDEEFIRDLAIQMLTKIGYEVSVANDGDQAIEMYRQAQKSGEPFDIVIMDLTIPGGMGGKEAIQKLIELDPNVKGLVSSGYSNDPIMSNFRDYGFQGVVKKPYRIQDMGDALRSVITVKTE